MHPHLTPAGFPHRVELSFPLDLEVQDGQCVVSSTALQDVSAISVTEEVLRYNDSCEDCPGEDEHYEAAQEILRGLTYPTGAALVPLLCQAVLEHRHFAEEPDNTALLTLYELACASPTPLGGAVRELFGDYCPTRPGMDSPEEEQSVLALDEQAGSADVALTVTLSSTAAAVLSAHIAPTEVVDIDGVCVPEEVHAELAAAFPPALIEGWLARVGKEGKQFYLPDAGI